MTGISIKKSEEFGRMTMQPRTNDYDIVHDNNNNVSQSTALNLNDYALPGYPEIKMVEEINQKYFQTELRTGLARSFLVGLSQFKLDNIITERHVIQRMQHRSKKKSISLKSLCVLRDVI